MQYFTNNAVSVTVGAIASGATSITVATGDGAKFPDTSSYIAGDYFLVTLFSYTGVTEVNHEIVKVTARSGDVLTVVRAQEGLIARAWPSGTPIQERLTAATIGRHELSTQNLGYAGGRNTLAAASNPYALGLLYSPTGGGVYMGATDNTSTPGFLMTGAGGNTLMSITNAGVMSLPGSLNMGPTFSAVQTAAAGETNIQAVGNAGYARLAWANSTRGAYGPWLSSEAALTSTTNLNIIADNATGILKFATGGAAERMRLTANGSLMLGVATPIGTGYYSNPALTIANADQAADSLLLIGTDAAHHIRLAFAGHSRGNYGPWLSNEGAVFSTAPITFMSDNAAGIMKWATGGPYETMRLDASGNLSNTGNHSFRPAVSATPASNGDLTFQAASNTQLALKYKGSDGVVRGVSFTIV